LLDLRGADGRLPPTAGKFSKVCPRAERAREEKRKMTGRWDRMLPEVELVAPGGESTAE